MIQIRKLVFLALIAIISCFSAILAATVTATGIMHLRFSNLVTQEECTLACYETMQEFCFKEGPNDEREIIATDR